MVRQMDFIALLAEHGVRMLPMGPQRVRAVTHLDVSMEQIEQACVVINRAAEEFAGREFAVS